MQGQEEAGSYSDFRMPAGGQSLRVRVCELREEPKKTMAAIISADALMATYSFQHAGGEFEVQLRPGGIFYAASYPDPKARWAVKEVAGAGTTVCINWGQFGYYELAVTDASTLEASGSAVDLATGVAAPADWRKMKATRPFSVCERCLFGAAGTGSEWSFEWSGGAFPVEFRADAYNHFYCKQYPAHSHWRLGGASVDELTIDWATFGQYEMKMAPDGKTGSGSAKGNPADWRKMTFVGDLGVVEDIDHGHGHSHGGVPCSGNH